MLSEIYDSAVECLKLVTGLGPDREKCGEQNFNNALKEGKVLRETPGPDPGPSPLSTSPTTDHETSPLPITTEQVGCDQFIRDNKPMSNKTS